MSATMTKSEIEKKIEEVVGGTKMAVMATISEGKPWARYVMTQADGLHLYTSTGRNSRKVKQIEENPNVHLTLGVKSEHEMTPYVQFAGKAIIHTDKETKKSKWLDAFAQFFSGPDDPNYVILEFVPQTIELMGATDDWSPLVWKA